MAQIKNKILFPNLNRNPEDEFPKQRVPYYLISKVEKLIQLHGDLELFVS